MSKVKKNLIGIMFIVVLFIFSAAYLTYLVTKQKRTIPYYYQEVIIEETDYKMMSC